MMAITTNSSTSVNAEFVFLVADILEPEERAVSSIPGKRDKNYRVEFE